MSGAAYLAHWDCPPEQAPAQTGAEAVMDLSDIREILTHFGFWLTGLRVVDVGCGTGRLADLCGDYTGYDIAPGMIAYARQHGRRVALIADLADYPAPADIVCCFSVFTHISRPDRQAYLERFAQLTDRVLIDILPGVEGGIPGEWYADKDAFEDDLIGAGFGTFDTYERRWPSGYLHRYYYARRRTP